ncbi:MAG TPA: tetratricopeptide repeat protein [Vulgatibacter sp.]|nr:tetratricopeptide repeat protein [Vulgatibacter sp.]
MAESTSGTKPTPAELAGLEHAFAVDSQSEAYRPLAEAYLELGRYMEAMVVGKAGARAFPTSPEPRLLLARIHSKQGRHRKAFEEAAAAVGLASGSAAVHLAAARIHLAGDDRGRAEELLQRALELAPEDPEVETLAAGHGIELKRPAPPEPEPPAAPAPSAATPDAEAAPAAKAPAEAASTGATPAATPAAASAAPAPPAARRDAPARPIASRPAFDPSAWDDDEDEAPPSPRARRQLVALATTAILVVLGLGGWYGFTRWSEARTLEISRLLDETNDHLRKDTYASYKAASATADRILALDSKNWVAHAYLAYIDALRWGEQGEGDDFARRAKEHLSKAKAAGQSHGRIVAAEAYIQFFDGDAKAAEETITKVLESGQRSGLLYTTLGTIQMWAGDLEKAAASLKQAQALEHNSVRVLSELGQLHRRRGMDADAWTFYDSALRIDGDHADSLLGKALLVLDANEVDRPKADRDKLLAEAERQIDKVSNLPEGAISARQLALSKFARAQLLFARERADDAERLEKEAFTLDPGNPDIRLMRGRRLLRRGDVDGAVADIREAIRIEPKRASFYVDLSRALLARSGGAKEAVEALKTAIETFPDSGRIWVLLGDAHRAVPDIDQARRAYERAIEAQGGRMPEARVKLGAIWREKREFAKAEEELDRALKELGLTASGPLLASALTELGRVFDERPNRDEQQAFERYARAIAASEGFAPPHFLVGRISAAHRSREQRRQAIDSLETYLRLAPKGDFADEARALLGRLR